MLIQKITYGFVTQVFDTEKQAWVRQDFTCGDQTEYENEEGDPLDSLDAEDMGAKYLPYEMKQPEQMKAEGWEGL